MNEQGPNDPNEQDGEPSGDEPNTGADQGRSQGTEHPPSNTERTSEHRVEPTHDEEHLIEALRGAPTIGLNDLAADFGKSPDAMRMFITRTEKRLGIRLRPTKTKPPTAPIRSAERSGAPLTEKTATKLAEVAHSRDVTHQKELAEEAAKTGQKPPDPLPEQPKGASSLEIGRGITGGQDDPEASGKAAKATADAMFQAIKAGELAKLTDRTIAWIFDAGSYAYAWWHTRGLETEFPAPKAMLDKTILYWWNYRDALDAFLGRIQLLEDERDELRRQLGEATSRRTAVSQVQGMIYLAATEGVKLDTEQITILLQNAESVREGGNDGGN